MYASSVSGIAIGSSAVSIAERGPRSFVFDGNIAFADGSRAARVDDHGVLEACRIPAHYIDGDEMAEMRRTLADAVKQINMLTDEVEALRILCGVVPDDVRQRWASQQ